MLTLVVALIALIAAAAASGAGSSAPHQAANHASKTAKKTAKKTATPTCVPMSAKAAKAAAAARKRAKAKLTAAKCIGVVPKHYQSALGDSAGSKSAYGGWTNIPATLGQPVVMRAKDGTQVGLQLMGAESAQRTSYANGAVFHGSDYDVVDRVTSNSLIQDPIVSRHFGLRTWRWQLNLPVGDVPHLDAAGNVELGNGLVVEAPVLRDANENPLPLAVHWALGNTTISLTFDDSSLPLPYAIDPDTTAPQLYYDNYTATSGNSYWPGYGDQIWFRPAGSGSFTVNFVAADPESGVAKVVFPALGTGWTPSGATNDTTPTSSTGGAATGNGLLGTYYGSDSPVNAPTSFGGPVVNRLDAQVNLNSSSGSTGVTGIPNTGYAIKWQGFVESPTGCTGAYTFSTNSDDGIKVIVGGTTVINDYTTHSSTNDTGNFSMGSNKRYPIEVDFFQNSGQALAQLMWSSTACSSVVSSTPVLIPQNHLYAPTYAQTYSWTAGAATPGTQAVSSTNNIVNLTENSGAAPETFTVSADSTLPTGGSITYPNGLQNTTSAPVTFVVGTDADSGVASTQLQRSVGTLSGGSCSGYGAFANIGPVNPTSVYTDSTLVTDHCYKWQLLVTDNVGNVATYTNPNTVQVDSNPPTGPASVNDGTGSDIAYTVSSTQIQGNYPAATDPGTGVAKYQTCVSTVTGCASGVAAAWADNGTSLSVTRSFSVVDGTTYYVCVRAVDNAGNTGAVACSNGQVDDRTAPTGPTTVNDGTGADITWLTSTSTISGNWSGASDGTGSGVVSYNACVSTATNCGGTVVIPWTNAGNVTTGSIGGQSLTQGQIYYICVQAVDAVGNVSTASCSNGQTVDTVAPTSVAPVNDGPGADIGFTNNNLQMQANWLASTDATSGLQKYQYCISTTNNCGGTPVTNWTDNGTTASVTKTYGSAIPDGTYYVCVRAYDNANNVSSVSCSNGQVLETAPPTPPTTVNDGATAPDIDYQLSTTTIAANWNAGTDAGSGMAKYQYCINTAADCTTGTPLVGWTDNALTLSVTRTGLALTTGTKYFVCVRDFDNAGNVSATIRCSNGVTVDTTPPVAPTTVNDGTAADVAWVGAGGTLSGNWTAATDVGSGIQKYQYCINTAADCTTGTPLVGWTDNGTALTVTKSGLSLTSGTTYYVCVRAVDNVGNLGAVACSNGAQVDTTPPTTPTPVNDGPGADILYTSNNLQLQANWTASTDSGIGLQKYQYCVSTTNSCGGTPITNWTDASPLTSTSVTQTYGSAIADGTYYVCVRAYDLAANVSTVACSNGQIVETTPPTPPASVADGLAADITYQQSGTTISANWPAGSDAGSGLAKYQYCISTTTSCGGAPIVNWTDTTTALGLSQTKAGLSLADGTKYFFCVRDYDNAGNVSATVTCSNGVTVDTSAPTLPSAVKDGATTGVDATWDGSSSSLSANWTASTDATSGLAKYQYCINTSAGCVTPVSGPTDTATPSFTATGLSLTDGTLYYACSRAVDNVGNTSAWVCSDGQTVDVTPPSATTPVNDGTGADILYTADNLHLSANWTAATDATSGVAKYQYCISSVTSCGGSPIVPWTDNAGTSVTKTFGSAVTDGQYFVCVRAVDNAGNTGAATCSNGQTVETTPPTPPASVADGLAADITFQQSQTSISANWPAGSDAGSGLQKYQYCINTAASCSGSPITSWTDVSPLLGLSVTQTVPSQPSGTKVYVCVRAWDNAGNVSGTFTCSDGVTIDAQAPNAPTTVSDGTAADITWSTSTSSISGNWSGAADALSGIKDYRYCVNTAPSCISPSPIVSTTTITGTSFTASASFTDGTEYYVCVIAEDTVGNQSSPACSNGQTVDATPPTTPTPVNDGPGADITFASNNHQVQANWTASTDATSGVAKYQYCINTSADCTTGTPLKGWTDNGTATSVTWASTPVIPDGLYYVCIRTVDNAGNTSAVACSNGQTMETTPPTPPASVADGLAADITYQASGSTISANWPAGSDAGSGLAKYQYCISTTTSCGGAPLVGWTDNAPLLATTFTATGLTLADATKYFICVRDYDNAGNVSATVTCSNGVTVDTTAPTVPSAVVDGPTSTDVTWDASASTISGTWTAGTDATSGVLGSSYCVNVSASCAGSPVVPVTATTGTTFTATATLAEGTLYYVCVKTTDTVGNASAWVCSNGQTVDSTPPTAATPVNDGPGADITFASNNHQIQANWTASTDATSGVAKYQYCVNTAADCTTGTPLKGWTDNGTATSVTWASTPVIPDGLYYVCVRAVDNAGNVGPVTCSNGQTMETQPPLPPATVADGTAADITWTNNGAQISANWPAGSDAGSGVQKYQYCVSTVTACGGAPIVNWTDTAPLLALTVTKTGLSLTDGTKYFVCVRDYDVAGNQSATVTCSDGQTADLTAPTVPTGVKDGTAADITWTQSTSSISANWTASTDATSGVASYSWCVSTAASCATTVATGTTTTPGFTGAAPLVDGTKYYVCVTATDTAGNTSTVACSNGQTVDATPPTAVAPVLDGPAADLTYTSSNTQLQANWTAATDATSGLVKYQVCISTVTSCGGTPVTPWTDNSPLTATTTTQTYGTPIADAKYYVCVKAFDAAGNTGAVSCSDGQIVETTPPTPPATVADGTAADIQYTASGTTLSANWPVGFDGGSGLAKYQYCISSTTACGGAPVVNWTDNAPVLGTTVTKTGLTLTDGTKYFVCVRDYDVAGNQSLTSTCSDGQTVDLTAPTVPTGVKDGTAADITWNLSTSSISGNWTASTDSPGSGVQGYLYCVNTAASCSAPTPTVALTPVTPASFTAAATLVDGTKYYVCVEAVDKVGNTSAAACSDGQTVDATAPPATAGVNDGPAADITYTSSNTQLQANWTAVTDPGAGASGTAKYQYCIATATACGGTSIVAWTDNSPLTATTLTKTGLTLTDGIYFICVRAVDTAGNLGAVACSNGQTVETQPPTIAFATYDTTGDSYAYWAGGASTKLWFNPTPPSAQNVDVVMHATDAGSGVNHVQFPGLGSGWTPAAGGPDATEDGSPAPVGNGLYRLTYGFGSGAATPGPGLTATGVDNAGNTQSSNAFDIEPDSTGPVSGAIAYTDGFDSATSITLNLTAGSDAQSGLGGWQILRAQGSLVAGSCTSVSAFTALAGASGTGAAPSTYTDSTLVDQACYRYELVATDRVQNSTTYTSTSTVELDHTPPTGSIVLTAGTPTAYQYLASPTHIYVNTAQAGSFGATVTASAASGVQSVGFPNLGASWTGAGLVPTAPYTKTFAWTAGAADPGIVNATVTSNSLGSLAVPFTVTADTTGPTGGSITYAGGFQSATSTSVVFTSGSDAGSGFASTQLQRSSATMTAGVCGTYGAWTNVGALNAPSPVADSTLASGLCYAYRLLQTDNVGNSAPVTSPSVVMVDTTAPTAAAVTLVAGSNPQYQYVSSPNHIWVNTAQAGGFSATVTGTDAESGIQKADLPTLGTGWTPAGITTVNAAPFTATYAWTASAVSPGLQSATAYDGVGLTTPAAFTVDADTTPPPAGATISYLNGVNSTLTDTVTFAAGPADTGSGTKDTLLERRSVAYDTATSTCGTTYGAWAQIGAASPSSPYSDTTVTRSNCYEYELVTEDNVGNQTTTTSPSVDIVTADVFPPQPFTVLDPTSATLPPITDGVGAPGCSSVPTYTSATPNLNWNGTVDNESGLNGYDVFIDGTTTAAGTVSATTTTYSPASALVDGAHTWGVQAFDMFNNRESSGPDYLHNIRIDTTAPTATLVTPAAGAFTASATPTLTWGATDANCVARVEVDVDGASAEVASGTETTYTPATALAEGPHTWQVKVYDGGGHITSSTTQSFSVDTTAPAAFDLTAPTAGQTVRGFVNVAWGASSDAGSGLASYKVYLDGVVSQTVSGTTTTATITGLTAGAHTVLVKALDAVGNVTTSTSSRTITAYAAIPAPVLVTPAAGAAINALPTLTWSWPSDGGPAPTDFDVKIDGAVATNVTYPTVTYAIPSLADGTHTWQIVQHDAYTGTVSSVTRTFILDRVAPTNPGPLTRTVTTISWPAATDALSGMAKIEFWINNGGGPVLTATLAGAATSYNYGTIPDGNYTMFTKAYDNAGNVTTSPTIAVTNDSGPPTAFSLNTPAAAVVPTITDGTSAPACGSVATFASTTPTFTWTASSDAVSGLEGYDVYIDGALKTNVAAPATSWTPGTAIPAGAHTWYVVAKDNFGNTQASTPATLNIAIDAAAPTITLGTPAAGSATNNTTPTLTWTSGDDACRSREQVTIDGSVVTTGTGTETSYAVPTALSEGSHTWSVKVWDAAGHSTASATRTFIVDTIAPAGVTATTPANASSVPESPSFSFTWTAATDAGSGVDHYDLYVDGVLTQSNITGTTSAATAIHAGSHAWTIRAFDVAGNHADFNFTFTATAVPDTTAPAAFHLLTPPNGSTITSGTALTWGASTDFNGIAQYKVYIDGYLTGSVPGSTLSYTPATGPGAPICTADFDGSSTAGCLGTFSYAAPWTVGAHGGNTSSGMGLGIDNDDEQQTTKAATVSVTVPSGGATFAFDSHWNEAATYDGNGKIVNAFDGGSVQISTDGGSTWGNTCLGNQLAAFYTTSLKCDYRIVTPAGGYTAVISNSTGNPLGQVNGFAGTSAGMVHTTMNLSQFAGTTVLVRFIQGYDYCWSGTATNCASLTPAEPSTNSTWDIDNVGLDTPALLPGLHSWLVKALDPSGNTTSSAETWSFTL